MNELDKKINIFNKKENPSKSFKKESILLAITDNSITKYTLILILCLNVFLIYMNWIGDNDLWWHLKYGEQLLSNKTIYPDHTVFTWTPVDKDWIYVTWLSDIVFYLMYSFGGLPMLYMFRYLVIGMILCMFILFKPNEENYNFYLVILISLIVSCMIYSTATQIKPEMISVLLFAVTCFVYLYGKIKEERVFYLYPLIFVLWVNSHGVFIFGLLFIGLVFVGEILNYVFKTKDALCSGCLKRLVLIIMISSLLIFINPYGIKYPLYIYEMLTSPSFQSYASSITAIQSPLDVLEQNIRESESFFIDINIALIISMAIIFTIFVLFALMKKTFFSFTLVLVNLVFLLLYFKTMRTTFFYPIVWGFSILYFIYRISFNQIRNRIVSLVCIVAFCSYSFIILSGINLNSSYEILKKGENLYTAQSAVNFLKKNDLLKYKMFNEYFIGGYLVWALVPEHRVFIDPRGSVFIKTGVWDDYARLFLSIGMYYAGDKIKTYSNEEILLKQNLFNEFVAKYQFKIAVVQMGIDNVVLSFLYNPNWRMVYFDQNSVIFVHKSVDISHINVDFSPIKFKEIKNLSAYVILFTFYLNLQDIRSAIYIYELMKVNYPNNALVKYCEKMLNLAIKTMQQQNVNLR